MTYKEEEVPGNDRHEVKAVLNLSGIQIEVGALIGVVESNPYINLPGEMEEPIYFSVPELNMLVASLCAAKAEIAGETSDSR